MLKRMCLSLAFHTFPARALHAFDFPLMIRTAHTLQLLDPRENRKPFFHEKHSFRADGQVV